MSILLHRTKSTISSKWRNCSARFFPAVLFLTLQVSTSWADIENTAHATAKFGDAIIRSDRQALSVPVVPAIPALSLQKKLISIKSPRPNSHRLTYEIIADNQGNITLDHISIVEDFSSIARLAEDLQVTNLSIAGFSEGARFNPAFNGITEQELLLDGAVLQPGQTGIITVDITIGTGAEAVTFRSEPVFDSRQLSDVMAADFPDIVSVNAGRQYTGLALGDSDGDGVPDYLESAEADRDGDGIADRDDFDPTGYFYCEVDGRIMPGGAIHIENLSSGGVQGGIGTGSGIVITRDGGDGDYKFHVTQAGRYKLQPIFPATGIASIARQPQPPLTKNAIEINPFIAGSGEMGQSGMLADHRAAANPYYLEFELSPGEPIILNNNLPMRFCGTSEIALELDRVGAPQFHDDGRARIIYQFEMRSTGTDRVDEIQIHSDLTETFGEDNYEIAGLELLSQPTGFVAAINPYFDGNSSTGLLTSGGKLESGETLFAQLTVLTGAPKGKYTHHAIANAIVPLKTAQIQPDTASAEVEILTIRGATDLSIAAQTVAQTANSVIIELEIHNPQSVGRQNLEIIGEIPRGTAYSENSARLNEDAVEPEFRQGRLIWRDVALAAEASMKITFELLVTAPLTGQGNFNGYIRDAESQTIISNLAQIPIVPDQEAFSACPIISGSVFDDRNYDGTRQTGEQGLANVRITLNNNRTARTGADGRFAFSCDDQENDTRNAAVALELDTTTLPPDYIIAAPRQRRSIAAGEEALVTFAAEPVIDITFQMEADFFEPDALTLNPQGLARLGDILNRLENMNAKILLIYETDRQEGNSLATQRVEFVTRLIRQFSNARETGRLISIQSKIE
jgi:hypothetical protein